MSSKNEWHILKEGIIKGPSKEDVVTIPAMLIPGFRTAVAIYNKCEKNLIFKTWGGLGDQICAEPTLRYALKKFKDCKVSLYTERPELFSHLKFDKIYTTKTDLPNWDNFLVFETITPSEDITWQFFCHLLVNCVDFPTICSLRSTLPIDEKNIILPSIEPMDDQIKALKGKILIHPGRHWETKTFPKDWWDAVIKYLVDHGETPVLIGADGNTITSGNTGTVDVNTTGCIDLRNKLSVTNSIWLCQNAKCLITNDSSPLHMAASGNAWVAFVATCKHPDMIKHWRHGEFGWREKNFGKSGMWDVMDYCPNKEQEIKVDKIDEAILRSWLPDPSEIAEWAYSREL